MDNPVYLDEDIPFVESGDYEIDEATGGPNGGGTTTMAHGNIISLNHQRHPFDDDPMWTSNVTSKRGRRPRSAAVVITTTPKAEPKRRGRKPKQDSLSSASANKASNDLLLNTSEQLSLKQRRTMTRIKANKQVKLDEQRHMIGNVRRHPPW